MEARRRRQTSRGICGGCFDWFGRRRAARLSGGPASRSTRDDISEVSECESYSEAFFEQPVGDRAAVFSVKHGLRGLVFGEDSAEGIPLWIADMDLPCSQEICRSLQRRLEHPTFGYTYQPKEMWEAAQRWIAEEHGWEVPLDSFVFCPSIVTAVAATLWAFTSPGDVVLIMTPIYEPLQKVVEGSNRMLRRHELRLRDGRYCWDLARLRAELQGCKMLIFCNPHNPGGRAWSPEELRDLASMCKEEGVLVASDEIWADWCLFGRRHRPLAMESAASGADASVITMMAPTKTWNLAGLQSSFLIILDEAMRKKYLAVVEPAFLHFGGTFASEGMLAAYTLGRPWHIGAKSFVEQHMGRCEAVFRQQCAPEVVPLVPEASYLLWLDCTALGISDPARFFREEAGVILSPGSLFGGAASAMFVRLNAATSSEVLGQALDQMVAAVAKVRAGFRPKWDTV